ncbi:MAG: PAS domain S-box protein, partial [Chitinophagaceae bacterium]
NMRYLALSNRCKTDYGFPDIPNEALYGKCHYDLFPAFPQHWKDINSRCLAGAVERSDEEAYTGPDGQTHWITYEVRPWHTANGDVGGIIIFTESITRIKEAELKFRSLVEKSMVGVFIVQNEIFTYINPRLAEIFGYTEEEMLGMPVENLVHTDYKRSVNMAIVPGEPGEEKAVNLEAKGITRLNNTIWFEAFGTTTLYNGAIATIGTLIDVTGRKKADETIKEKMTQIQNITDNLPYIVVYQTIRHQDGRRELVYVSEGVQRITGLTTEESLKSQYLGFDQFEQEDWEKVMEAEIASYNNLTMMRVPVQIKTYLGQPLTVEIVAVPRKLDNNAVLWDGILTDITEIKLAEKELLHKNYEINEIFKALIIFSDFQY